MGLENVLAGAALLCVVAALLVRLFRSANRLTKHKAELEQMEKWLDENDP